MFSPFVFLSTSHLDHGEVLVFSLTIVVLDWPCLTLVILWNCFSSATANQDLAANARLAPSCERLLFPFSVGTSAPAAPKGRLGLLPSKPTKSRLPLAGTEPPSTLVQRRKVTLETYVVQRFTLNPELDSSFLKAEFLTLLNALRSGTHHIQDISQGYHPMRSNVS